MVSMVPLNSCPEWASLQVEELKRRGVPVALVEIAGQCYARVRGIPAASPPWDKSVYDILIAIPLAACAALDAFYLRLPYQYSGSTHKRVCGNVIGFDGQSWQLVSWHYPDGHAWTPGRDDLDSPIAHCKGFLFNRGAINAIG